MENLIDKSLEIAKSLGVNNCDVIFSSGETFSLKSEKGDLSEYKKANSHSLGVRVIHEDRVGMSYTEAIDDESIKFVINSAKNNAKYSKVDKHQKIVAKDQRIKDENPEVYVDFSPSAEEMIEKSLYLENEVLKRESLSKNAPYNGVSEGTSRTYIGNTLGTLCSYRSKYYTCMTSALLSDGDKNSMHYKYDLKRDYRELDFDGCINESIEVAKNLLTAKQVKTGKYNVSFSTNIFSNLFSAFSSMLSARTVIDKTNPWKDSLGKDVTTSKLTITDDPLYGDGFSSVPFDSEGFIRKKNILVENGVLKQFIQNSATASELGMENNFCASRGSKSSLGVSFSNIIIGKGEDSKSDFDSIDYLEITHAQGLHSGVNVVSGNFSVGVSGVVHSKGEITGHFKDVTVSGNFYEMLKNISILGDTIYGNDDKSFFSPRIIFPNTQIAGS